MTSTVKIPEGWIETTLGEIAIINPTESLKKGTDSICVPMDCIDNFTRKISKYKHEKYGGGTKFRNGDTLMARITPCLENGKTAFVDFLQNGEIAFGSTEYIVIREKSGFSDKLFLYYLSISPNFRDLAIKSMTGTSGRQRVQTQVLVNKKILLPPLPEQKAIAGVLSSFDDKIELLRAENQTLEEMGQTLFKERFGKYRIGDELPDDWKVGKLTDIADFLNGIALQKFPPKGDEKGLPVVKIREMKTGITGETDRATKDIDEKYIIQNEDVLFSRSGSLELVFWEYGPGALNQHLFKVSSDKYPKWFYYYWIKHHLTEFRSIASNKATTMGHIQRCHLERAEVIIPSDNDLHKFDEVMDKLLKKIFNNKNKIHSLTETCDQLLPKLMSGEVRVEF